MMNNHISRLHTVSSSEEGANAGVPMEILRFAMLPDDRRTILVQVNDLLEQIGYGTVVIVMHEGKIIQIETSEKMRLT